MVMVAPLSKDCELGEMQQLVTSTPRSSILRKVQAQQQEDTSSLSPSSIPSMPSPDRRRSVQWSDGPRKQPSSLVTATYHRPRTPIADVPLLYYSTSDVKSFKREFRTMLRSQRLARQRLQQNSEEIMSSFFDNTTSQQEKTTMTQKDNSFWRSKISRWSAQSSTTSSSLRSKNDHQSTQAYCDDLHNEVSYKQEGGIFSKLFGTSSAYYQKDKPATHHLVDTLYLF